MVDRPQYTVLDKDEAAVQKLPMLEGLTNIRYKIKLTSILYTSYTRLTLCKLCGT